jgi:hypothetical protein
VTVLIKQGYQKYYKRMSKGLEEYNSMVKHLPYILGAMGLICTTLKKKCQRVIVKNVTKAKYMTL